MSRRHRAEKRDVIPDARSGRVYLPADWLAAAGVADGDVLALHNREAVHRVTCRLLDIADAYYESAKAGIALLPFRSAWSIAAALRIYRGIGDVVRRRGTRAWEVRARTSKGGKLANLSLAIIDANPAAKYWATGTTTPRNGLWTPQSLGDG